MDILKSGDRNSPLSSSNQTNMEFGRKLPDKKPDQFIQLNGYWQILIGCNVSLGQTLFFSGKELTLVNLRSK